MKTLSDRLKLGESVSSRPPPKKVLEKFLRLKENGIIWNSRSMKRNEEL
jgi:hypothetical protein